MRAKREEWRLWDNRPASVHSLPMPESSPAQPVAILALLVSAAVWGLIWYPYRLLRDAGVGGELATLLTYLIALAAALPLAAKERSRVARPSLLLAIAAAGAAANLGYVLALLDGRVVVVLLLFYLAPVWTPLLAWWLLGERAGVRALGAVLLALGGAMIMLWRPESDAWVLGLPEWLGLAAGFSFAMCNVLLRRGRDIPVGQRSVALFGGVAALAAVAWLSRADGATSAVLMRSEAWLWIVGLGLTLMIANLVLQYGLARITANRAIVILLVELPVGALAAFAFAGELLRWTDFLGGALIILACLASGTAREDRRRGWSSPHRELSS